MGVTALLAGAGLAALVVSGCSTSSTTVEKTTSSGGDPGKHGGKGHHGD